MRETRLASLLEEARVTYINNKNEFNTQLVSSISTDTRSLKKGELFIAIRGDKYDGHSFIADALNKEAGCVIFESGMINDIKLLLAEYPELLFVGVKDSRKALGKMAKRYLEDFSVKKIAITGTAGKTTTKQLVTSVIARRFNVVSSAGSFNNDIGVPKTIFDVDEETDFLVQELGTNHPGEIAGLSEIVRQNFALITNIGPAHIGFFNSEEEIAREKKQALEVPDSTGTVFLNAEDKFFEYLKSGIKADIKSFGLRKGDLFPDRVLKASLDGSEFVLAGEKIRAKVSGEHGIVNAVAAALLGLFFGLTAGEIKCGIESYTDTSGRGRVYDLDIFTVIDESYNANPLSVSASIKFIDSIPVSGRKILVLGDMLELGSKSGYYHRLIGERIIESGIALLFAYGRETAETVSTCKQAGFNNVLHFTDLDDLVSALKNGAKKGDLIMVKGSRAMNLERVIKALTGV
jgi:UDP-N-acetylmuramoyl-tripeptide--D-alanyl-D-alanine ligase